MNRLKFPPLVNSTSLLIQLRKVGYEGPVPTSSSELRELLEYLKSVP